MTDETRVEQKVAKQNHQDKLDAWYAESWVKKGALDQERAQQVCSSLPCVLHLLAHVFIVSSLPLFVLSHCVLRLSTAAFFLPSSHNCTVRIRNGPSGKKSAVTLSSASSLPRHKDRLKTQLSKLA